MSWKLSSHSLFVDIVIKSMLSSKFTSGPWNGFCPKFPNFWFSVNPATWIWQKAQKMQKKSRFYLCLHLWNSIFHSYGPELKREIRFLAQERNIESEHNRDRFLARIFRRYRIHLFLRIAILLVLAAFPVFHFLFYDSVRPD